jgi:hypothetical protein
MLELCERVKEKHDELGAESPLDDAMMTALAAKLTTAKSKRELSKELRAQSEARMQESTNILGRGKGQTSKTPGTLYYDLTGVRDKLLLHFRDIEEGMSEFGIDVRIKTSSPGRKRKPKEKK